MVVPLIARYMAAAVGALLVLATGASVVGTLIVARNVSGWLTSWLHPFVVRAFRRATAGIADYRRRDRILAGEAASILIAQLVGWLAVSFVGYALLFWPFVSGGVTTAFAAAGSSLFTLGFEVPPGGPPKVLVCIAAGTGLLIVSLQIAYLPSLYSAFNRRETKVALLNSRGRSPVLGPELLRPHPLCPGIGCVDPQHLARPVRPMGALGCRCGGKPHDIPPFGALPITQAAVLLANRTIGDARLSGSVLGTVPPIGAGGTGPPVLAQRLSLHQPDRQRGGHPRP